MAYDASNTERKPGVEAQKANMEAQPSGDVEKAGGDSASTTAKPADEQEYPPLRKVIVIVLSLYLATFLISLDRLIIVTAIPRITDEFHSLGDIGWYGSGYMLTTCSFQLFFGRLYTFHSPKMIFPACIFIFEVGSALCGAAPNSQVFILGRAVAGLGAAGIFGGAIVITVSVVPLHKRPILMALNAGLFAISSVVGPCRSTYFFFRKLLSDSSRLTRLEWLVVLSLQTKLEMVFLHQSTIWRIRDGYTGLCVESSSSKGKVLDLQTASGSTRYNRDMHFRSLHCVPPSRTAVGRLNLPVEQWPHHRSPDTFWRPPYCICWRADMGWERHSPSSHHQAAERHRSRPIHHLCGCDHVGDGLLPASVVSGYQGRFCREVWHRDHPLRPRPGRRRHLRRRLHATRRLLRPADDRLCRARPCRDGPLHDLPNRHGARQVDRIPSPPRPRRRPRHAAGFPGGPDVSGRDRRPHRREPDVLRPAARRRRLRLGRAEHPVQLTHQRAGGCEDPGLEPADRGGCWSDQSTRRREAGVSGAGAESVQPRHNNRV